MLAHLLLLLLWSRQWPIDDTPVRRVRSITQNLDLVPSPPEAPTSSHPATTVPAPTPPAARKAKVLRRNNQADHTRTNANATGDKKEPQEANQRSLVRLLPAPSTTPALSPSVPPVELFPHDIGRLTPPHERLPFGQDAPRWLPGYDKAIQPFAVRLIGAFRPEGNDVLKHGELPGASILEWLDFEKELKLSMLGSNNMTFFPDDFPTMNNPMGGVRLCVCGCTANHRQASLDLLIEVAHIRGVIRRARIVRTSGVPEVDEAAIEAVRHIEHFAADEARQFGPSVEMTRWQISMEVFRYTRNELICDPLFEPPGEVFREDWWEIYSLFTRVELLEVFPDPVLDPHWRPETKAQK